MKYTGFLILMLTFGFIGCKGKTNSTTQGSLTKANTVLLKSNDQMKYDKNEITVEGGKRVQLTLKHTGKLNKTIMGHNFVLLKKGTDLKAFATKAMSAKATGYVPPSLKDSVIAKTKLIGGGESDTISFKAPAPGTYDYLCTFPGHFALMKGKFIVK